MKLRLPADRSKSLARKMAETRRTDCVARGECSGEGKDQGPQCCCPSREKGSSKRGCRHDGGGDGAMSRRHGQQKHSNIFPAQTVNENA